jgi:hypothetical protein
MNTKNRTNQIVALLSTAITASLSGDDVTATQNTAQALRLLANGTVRAIKVGANETTKAVKRGAKPLMNPSEIASLARRVADGETVVSVAKHFGISYPTAHRYLRAHRQRQGASNNN